MIALDFVSPLPPSRSGIADYSLDLLPHLAARADLRLVRVQARVDSDVSERWPLAERADLGQAGRLPLYQMGNNRHHLDVYEAALEHPGVLTLHDLVLHHFQLERTLADGDLEAYLEVVSTDDGWAGYTAGRLLGWGGRGDAARFAFPVRRSLLRTQRGVLVHSRWAAAQLLEDDSSLRVRAVPMGIPLPPLPEAGAGLSWRRVRGIPAAAPLLGSFGFQTPIKRTDVAIRALAHASLAAAHLLVGGESSPALDLVAEAEAAGVGDRVHFIGYVPFGELQQAIAATDLCLNLRYPSAGETSASLLRVLALGRPAVVSDYAQFAELPDDVVVKVPLAADEAAGLADQVGALLGNPGRLHELGENARSYIRRQHDPASAAAAIVAACEAWWDVEPPGIGEPPPFRPTTLTWGEAKGSIAVAGTEAPWAVGERRRLRVRLENRGRATWIAGRRGPGGVAIAVSLVGGARSVESSAWMSLPRDVAPGDGVEMAIFVRRPPSRSRLRVEPKILGGPGFEEIGGPVWNEELR